jgi:hypothetical protein
MPIVKRETGKFKGGGIGRGFTFIATEKGDDVIVLRGNIRDIRRRPFGWEPEIGLAVTFIRVPVTGTKPNGEKLCDRAIDVEVLP